MDISKIESLLNQCKNNCSNCQAYPLPIDLMNESFLSVDLDFSVLDANASACAYLKVERKEAIGKRLDHLISGFDDSLIKAKMAYAAKSGEVESFDAPSPLYPGNWMHVRCFPFRGGAGCFFVNSTARLPLDHRFVQLTALEEALSASGSMGRALLTPRATLVQADPVLVELLGLSAAVLEQTMLSHIIPASHRVAAMQQVEQVLSKGGTANFATKFLTNAGVERPVNVTLAQLREEYAPSGALMLVSPMHN